VLKVLGNYFMLKNSNPRLMPTKIRTNAASVLFKNFLTNSDSKL
jgi:hypothetical protein